MQQQQHHGDDDLDRQVARRSAYMYIAISLTVALTFLTLATLQGGYTDVARFGGTLWVFLLSLIVTMPLVTSWYKKRTHQ